jgi:hypothetical protein
MNAEHIIPPKVFISYSHDSAAHKKWVLEFATTIRDRGADAILDLWDLRPGDDLPRFMETSLAQANFVVIICTEKYVEKANIGAGGVGYEKMIITASMLSRIDTNIVIPIIRQEGTRLLPSFMGSKVYIDFSNDDEVEYNFDDLMRKLLDAPLFEKPPIGTNPFKPMEQSRPDRTSDVVRQVMSDVFVAYEGTHQEFIPYARLVKQTSLRRLTLDIYVNKAIEEGLLEKSKQYADAILVTPKGLKYLADREIIET